MKFFAFITQTTCHLMIFSCSSLFFMSKHKFAVKIVNNIYQHQPKYLDSKNTTKETNERCCHRLLHYSFVLAKKIIVES